MRYQNVTILPGVFYDSHGHIRRKLLECILQKCAESNSLTFGHFLKQLCKFSTKKSPSSAIRRLDFVLDILPTSSFRKKWYRGADRKTEKAIMSFFNSIYAYVIERYPALEFDSINMRDVVWTKAPRGTFLKADCLDRLLDISAELQVSDESLALYLWAFIEAHCWHDVGSSEKESYETFRNEFETLLKRHDKESLLALCLASEKKSESETAFEVAIDPRTKEKNKRKSLSDFKEQVGKNGDEVEPESLESLPELNSELRSQDGMMEAYRLLLFQVIKGKDEVQKLNAMSRYDQLEKQLPKIRDLEKKHTEVLGEIESWLESSGSRTEIPIAPDDLLISRIAAKSFLKKLEKAVEKTLKVRQANIELSKKELVEDLRVTGIEEPEELEHVSTMEGLARIRESLKTEMQVSMALYRMKQEGFDAGFIKDMSEEERVDLYERLVAASANPSLLKETLRYMTGENRFSGKLIDRQLSVALKTSEALMACGGSLPDSFWAMLQKLSPDNPFKKAGEGKFFELLQNAPEIDMEGLDQTALGQEEKLPEWLVGRILLSRLTKLRPEERIAFLAKRLRDAPQDADTGLIMIRTLCELERYREALYLGSIGARIAWPGLNDEMLREPLLRTLLEIGEKLEKENSLLRELLEDASWLVDSEEYILVFLYLIYQSHMEDVYFNFKYQSPDAMEAARSSYPILTDKLVALNERNLFLEEPTRDPNEDLVEEGRKALLKFDEAQEKPSCYSSWAPAFKYQAYFREYFQDIFQSVRRQDKINEFSSEEILAKAMAEGNLAKAEGDAARNMRRFIEEQIERLNIISEAFQTFSEKELRRGSLREAPSLEKENERVAENSILKAVYKRLTG